MKDIIDQQTPELYNAQCRKAYRYASEGLVVLAILFGLISILRLYSNDKFIIFWDDFLPLGGVLGLYLPYAVWFYRIGLRKNEKISITPLALMLVLPVMILFSGVLSNCGHSKIFDIYRIINFIGICSLALIISAAWRTLKKKTKFSTINSLVLSESIPVFLACFLLFVLGKGEAATLCWYFCMAGLCLVAFIGGNILLIHQAWQNYKAARRLQNIP